MELSNITKNEWWKDYETIQTSMRVRGGYLTNQDLSTSTKSFTEMSFYKTKSESELTSLECALALAKVIEKTGHQANLITYKECYTVFYGILLDSKYYLDVTRENICIHFEKGTHEDKVFKLKLFHQEGLETLESFKSRGRRYELFLLGRPTIADEALMYFLESRKRLLDKKFLFAKGVV